MDLKKIQRSDTCLNCGLTLNPGKNNFCPECGQLNNIKKETALDLVRELIGDFMHLDSKISRSIFPLLFRPGYLTKEFISGRRVRYFHPVRMFLTLTVILFIISGLQEKHKPQKLKISNMGANADSTTLAVQSAETKKDTSSLNIDTLRRMINAGNMDNDAMMEKLGIQKNVFSKIIFSQFVRVQKQGFEKLRDYYSDKLSWMLFALMPVFAFVLYLLYLRKKIYFVDHLIHAFHIHSAVFLIMSLAGLLQWLTGWSTNWMLLYIPVYYYISQHRVYGQPWPISIAKSTLAGILYLMLGLFALFLVAGIMFMMY